MLLRDMLLWVWRAVWMHRARSLLSICGFAIGIAAMVLLTSFGEGLRQYVMSEFTQFGSHIIVVKPGRSTTIGLESILKTTRPLTLDDAEAIQRLAGVETVVPVVGGLLPIEANGRIRSTDISAVGPGAAMAFNMAVAKGSFLPDEDWDSARQFAVLGSKLKTEMFGDSHALGEYLRVGGSRYRVVGVMASKGQLLGFDLDSILFIPVASGLQLFNRDSLMEINVFYNPVLTSASVSARVRDLLLQRHGFEDFTLTSQDEMLKTLDNILQILKFAGAGLGAISLLVGGVGILTILMITVTERTQEVGLLRALGATRSQVRNLFLGEAVLLAFTGGAIGVLSVGLLQLALLFVLPQLPLSMSIGTVALALASATLIGVISGVRPALNATRLSPIDALRSE